MSRDGGLRQLFQTAMREAHWQAIETWSTGQGVPDAEYCFPGGIGGWVEFKKANGWSAGLRPEQVAWLERRARVGGRTFVAVRKQLKSQDDLYVFAGIDVRQLHLLGLTGVKPLILTSGGPAKWDWPGVKKVITA